MTRRRMRLWAGVLLVAGATVGAGAWWARASLRRPFDSGGPYLQAVTHDAATVALLTETPRRFAVELEAEVPLEPPEGRAAGAAGDSPPPVTLTAEPEAGRIHALRLTGLSPDTRYRYRVRDADAETDAVLWEGALRTAPPPGARSVRLGVIGDSGGVRGTAWFLPGAVRGLVSRDRPHRQAALVRLLMEEARPEVVLHTGDVVYELGERERYHEAFFEPFAPLVRSVPLYPALSNHDLKTEAGQPWLDAFHLPEGSPEGGERYYSFDWGDAHVVVLDGHASPRGPGSAQARWLERDLAAARAAWTIALVHGGPYHAAGRRENLELREGLVPILRTHGVRLVVSGHHHSYQRLGPIDGTWYVVTGGGGTKLHQVLPDERLQASASRHHILSIELDARRLHLRAIAEGPEVIDELVLEH